jgi:delta 1-pyrroline-5-carboxylate dehydrogenase
MIRATYPFWLASKAVHANTDLVVRDKHTQEIASRVAQADDAHIDAAFAAAAAAAPAMAARPPASAAKCCRWTPRRAPSGGTASCGARPSVLARSSRPSTSR